MMKSAALFLLLLLCAHEGHSFKYLVYNPKISKSHVLYLGGLADLLAKHGHDVVNYQPLHTNNYEETGVKVARSIIRPADYGFELNFTAFGGDAWKGMSLVKLFQMNTTAIFENACRHQMADHELIKKLDAEKFDFAFTEIMDLCSFILFQRLGIQRYGIVYATSMPMLITSLLGIPSTASFVPDGMTAAIPPLTFMERVKNALGVQLVSLVFKPKFIDPFTSLGREYFGDNFEIMEKVAEAQLIFVNVDEFLDFPRPISHKIRYIGGVGLKRPEPLTDKYKEIFDRADKVVYMSFGTVAPSFLMPPETKQMFLEAFSRFKDVTFLWKYETPEDGISKGYPNVILDKWWPQKDLLGQKKLLCFITHGGMNSVSEASHAGAPLVAIPLFGDQHRNAKIAEHKGFGIQLDLFKLSADTIAEAIQRVTEDKSYKQHALEISNLMNSKPFGPEEEFLKYSEFAAQFDIHSWLDMSGRKLSTFHFYNIDVFLFILLVLSIVVIVLYVSVRLLFKLFKRCCRRGGGGDKNKKDQ